jgi:hypothetical protein
MQQALADVDLRFGRLDYPVMDRYQQQQLPIDVRLMIHKLKLSDGKTGRKFADP